MVGIFNEIPILLLPAFTKITSFMNLSSDTQPSSQPMIEWPFIDTQFTGLRNVVKRLIPRSQANLSAKYTISRDMCNFIFKTFCPKIKIDISIIFFNM